MLMHDEQPDWFGPVAAVLLSSQQPYFEAKQPVSLGLGVVVVLPGLVGFVGFVAFVGLSVVVGAAVVVGGGHPSLLFPSEAVAPSGQHPKRESLQSAFGQPFP